MFSQIYSYYDNGMRSGVVEQQRQPNGTTETITTTWTYNNLSHLTSESVTNSVSSQSFENITRTIWTTTA